MINLVKKKKNKERKNIKKKSISVDSDIHPHCETSKECSKNFEK